jgi:hypothetical protein
MVLVGADGVHAQQLAGHLEAGDLFGAVAVDLVGLEVAKADRVQVLERSPMRNRVPPRATLRRRPMICPAAPYRCCRAPSAGKAGACCTSTAGLEDVDGRAGYQRRKFSYHAPSVADQTLARLFRS